MSTFAVFQLSLNCVAHVNVSIVEHRCYVFLPLELSVPVYIRESASTVYELKIIIIVEDALLSSHL